MNVELAGVTKSGLKNVSCIVYGGAGRNAQSHEMCGFGAPGGGGFVPSMSAGRKLNRDVLLKQICVAGNPEYIAVLLYAQARPPLNPPAAGNMLYVMYSASGHTPILP